MAGLRNRNGEIVIDEREAENDIKKISQAQNKLEEVLERLNPDHIDINRMQGAMRDAYEIALRELVKDISNKIQRCIALIEMIRRVVRYYKAMDEAYANKMR